MEKLLKFISHPASGWFKASSAKKRKSSTGSKYPSSVPPDSFHSRSGAKKKDNPRYNPAP